MAKKWIWKKWWVLMWATIVPVGTTLTFLLEQPLTAIVPAALFGAPEAFALWSGRGKSARLNPYPPLTYTTKFYLPRWLTYALFGGIVTSVGWVATEGLPLPARLAAIGALFAWLVEHFELTYREMPMPE